jgi:hypothetical protein
MSSDEWTIITKSNARNRKQKKGAAQACTGLYRSNNHVAAAQHGDVDSKSKEQIQNAIIDCINSLERQYQSGKGFAYRLIDAISSDADNFHLNEIVVYGIGNFLTELYSPSMLQLAGALLLRRLVAAKFSNDSDGTNAATNQKDGDVSFRQDQQRVPIYYYEPCIVGAEKEMLQEVFCVHTLENNDMGKLPVFNMRQNNATALQQDAEKNGGSRYTLFYMPHCPMRLYCNVIWAHWDHICISEMVNSRFNPIMIFGNSFHAYDERMISSDQRMDPTNGMLRLVPFINEKSVYISSENRDLEDSLRMMDRAFNDCNVISFSVDKDFVVEKPTEYVPSDDPYQNGELL